MASRSFATFRLNGQVFGIDILLIREINRQLDITMIPHAPEYIRGLLNLRGQVVTLLDLNRRLGFPAASLGESSHNIILKTEQELQSMGSTMTTVADKVGLLIDEVDDVVNISEEDIALPPANIGKVDGQFLTGVIKQPDNLIAILNVEKLLR